MEGLPAKIGIKDITLTGSLANYNWSNYSDFDLHIIVDFYELDANLVLVKSFFDNARMRWNDKHSIMIKGYEVEIYVEDQRESHKSSGLYSIMNDEWIKKPKKYQSEIDFTSARKKADDIEFQVNIASNLINAGKYKTALRNIERLKKIQLDLHKDFIDVVEKSRGSKLKKSEVELFSGEFWSGSKAKDLGLIDGIGDAHQVLKEKFGNDVVIKKFEKSKGWLSQKLSSSNNQVDQLANILDERSIWQRYGF